MKAGNHILKLIILIPFLFLPSLFLTAQEHELKIHYLGHSAFVLEFDNGITVVTDYGHENVWKEWGWDSPINTINRLVPDVMTYSHTNH